MSTYLDMKKPCGQPQPSPSKAMTMKRGAIALRLWVARTLLTAFRPIIGGRPAMRRRIRNRAVSSW